MTPPPQFTDNHPIDPDEYEEISSAEVDRVVESLESLIESVQSENIRAYLNEAADNVYSLIYDAEGQPHSPAENMDDEYRGEAA